jgi:hypothetical protein
MFPDTRAHARRTDPETSHEAAASIPEEKLTEAQDAVLRTLKVHGPLWDQQIFVVLAESGYRISPSGCRTRRSELVALGKVEFAKVYHKLPSGRRSRVWKLSE